MILTIISRTGPEGPEAQRFAYSSTRPTTSTLTSGAKASVGPENSTGTTPAIGVPFPRTAPTWGSIATYHENQTMKLLTLWQTLAGAVLALGFSQAPPLALEVDGNAPAVPDGLFEDPRATWTPTLDATATVVVEANGTVTSYKTGIPTTIAVPSNRRALGVALEQCANNDGDWVGFYGTHNYELTIGSTPGPRDVGRPQGYQGISLIGLETDPSNSDQSVLWGVHFAQHIGVNKDLAFANFTVDSHSIMPIQTADLSHPPFGNIYLERLKFLVISNDQAKNPLPPGIDPALKKNATTRVIRGHGAARWHILYCDMLDGWQPGDGQAGASEHFFYYDAQQGDSEVIGCRVRGAQWSGVQCVSRYTDRFKVGGVWQERYAFGKLLVDDCWFENVGSAGTGCINIAGGGIVDCTVRNMHYEANYVPSNSTGQVLPKGWPGMALLCYVDKKAFELDSTSIDPNTGKPYTAGQGPPIALGYSMNATGGSLPPSELMDASLPTDGFGACRSFTVIGGTFRRNNGGNAPLFNFRDCANVTIIEVAQGATPFNSTGGVMMFCQGGLFEQNKKAGDGKVPAKCGPGYWQQARLISRKNKPSTWIGPIKMAASRTSLSGAEIDSWWN